MAVMGQVRGGNVGSVINPTLLSGAAGATAAGPNAQKTFTIDASKTYIAAISINITSSNTNYYMDTWLVKDGSATLIHDSPNAGTSVTISGTTLTLVNNATGYTASYQVIQLD